MIIILAISNVSGLGGGGVLIPMIMVFFKFDTKNAATQTSMAIFWSSIARYILQIKAKHPEKDATVIDYGVCSIMMPTLLFGSFVGALINVIFPDLLIGIILAVLLFVLGFYSTKKAIDSTTKENIKLKKIKDKEEEDKRKNGQEQEQNKLA